MINRDRLVVRSIDAFEILPGSLEAMARISATDYKIIVVTNKGSVGVGLLSEARLAEIHAKMTDEIQKAGGRVDATYHCPHIPLPVFGCGCRKPKPGMLLRAAREHDIELAESWMIGDNVSDIEAGRAAGCKAVLLTTTHGEAIRDRGVRAGAELIAPNLSEAVEAILQGALASKVAEPG